MARNHAVLNGPVKIIIRNLGRDKRVQMLFISPSSQLVDATLLDLPGAGTAEDEVQVIFDHQFVDYVQKFRELLDFIYNDQGLGRILHKHLIELHSASLEALPRIGVKKVNVNGLRESLTEKRGFPNLTATKQEHSLIKAVLYVENSSIHKACEILQRR